METQARALSPLQIAAIERIDFFQRELEKKGFYVRTGMELEFFVVEGTQQNGRVLIPSQIGYKQVESRFHDSIAQTQLGRNRQLELKPESVPFIIDPKGICNFPQSQFELVIGEKDNIDTSYLSPLAIAEIAADAKKGGLVKALNEQFHSTTALHTSFAAVPFPGHANYNLATSGMHINASLWDKQQNNLFVTDAELVDKAKKNMLAVQYHAALLMLPTANSYARLKRNDSTPHAIRVAGKEGKDLGADKEFTLRHVTRPKNSLQDKNNVHRIENRLPGADADPYVAMAATMAALYLAKVKPDMEMPPSGEELPPDVDTALRRFERGGGFMKEVFGEAFYHAAVEDAKAQVQPVFSR